MAQLVLNQQTLERIADDNLLQAKVADALGVSITSMPRILKENGIKLTSAGVMVVLREHLKTNEDSELLTQLEAA